MAPGAWLRAGMGGAVAGVDIEAGIARLDPAGLDLTIVRQLAAMGEGMAGDDGVATGFLAGVARLEERERQARG